MTLIGTKDSAHDLILKFSRCVCSHSSFLEWRNGCTKFCLLCSWNSKSCCYQWFVCHDKTLKSAMHAHSGSPPPSPCQCKSAWCTGNENTAVSQFVCIVFHFYSQFQMQRLPSIIGASLNDSSPCNSTPMNLLSARDRLRLEREERATARLQCWCQREQEGRRSERTKVRQARLDRRRVRDVRGVCRIQWVHRRGVKQ